MRLAVATAIMIATAGPVLSQDRQGRDTPGEWIVDHYRSFGLWDSACDHRITDNTREERCYLRYVEVFSPHPEFGAQFLFITPGPEVELGIERGTRFAEGGLRIEQDGATVWQSEDRGCLRGRECRLTETAATDLVRSMADGGTFIFDFTDRHGKSQSLRWDLTPFADALTDFEAQSATRSLLP